MLHRWSLVPWWIFNIDTRGGGVDLSPGKYLKSLPEENDLRWFITTELLQSLKGFDKVTFLKSPIISKDCDTDVCFKSPSVSNDC